ncbi:MAG: 3-phosphoshikimate 1-carboxyvinyltransferase [Rickettsiales bacterium]|nr:3-phosphoshikimate 1-carboxyvinyltransferase [Rickettsiales bacterium]OUV80965.1 MAG: 3-phosphoshikimate 1-carboxyvinyltransferase [Rickettsiales bacterium TMED131]|tara:strand:+ start:435 stop:1787 length:1353 start_codon:yes stop_codon:yes gene_type:complete
MYILKKNKKKSSKSLDNMAVNNICLKGNVGVPGDKSISQRALILGLLSIGETVIEGILDSEDVYYTLKAVEALGGKVNIDKKNNSLTITGIGLGNLMSPKKPVYMGNSGTGTRLLMGVVAGSNATVTFCGDDSLSNRPMDRIIEPLEKMGANFIFSDQKKLPITVLGARKKGFTMPIKYKLPMASAQVKSSIIFSALTARGATIIKEPFKSRSYTEEMLKKCGVKIKTSLGNNYSNTIEVNGAEYLKNCKFTIPGDPSSAAFLIVACLIKEGSKITVNNVLNDPMRLKVFKVLKKMGAKISFNRVSKNICNISAEYSKLTNICLKSNEVVSLIDEFPILSIAAACGEGKMSMKGLGELRFKESDRFLAIKEGLIACGVNVNSFGDDMEIIGKKQVNGEAEINSNNDHRIAMAFNILGLVALKPIKIIGNKSIRTSFPNFFETIKSLTQRK